MAGPSMVSIHRCNLQEGEQALYEPENKRPSEGHPLTGDHRERDMSRHKKKVTKQGDSPLETTEGGTCQGTERKRLSNGHSQTRDHRGRVLSQPT